MSEISVNNLFVVPTGVHAPLSDDQIKGLAGKKPPTLKDLVLAVKDSLKEAGVETWEASIEVWLEAGTGSLIPGGNAGVKTTLKISGKT